MGGDGVENSMSDPERPAEEDAPLEDRLGAAALAAVMGDPYEVGLRIALDDGVAEAMPAVARELAWLDAAVAATQGRLAGLAPVAIPAAVAAGMAAGDASTPEPVAQAAGFVAGAAPSLSVSQGERAAPVGLVAAPVDLVSAPMDLVAVPMDLVAVAERAAPLVRTESAAGAMAQVAAGVAASPVAAPGAMGRLDWGGTDWGRLAAVPGVAAEAVPRSAVPNAAGFEAAAPVTPMRFDEDTVAPFGAEPAAAPLAMPAMVQAGEAVRLGNASAPPETTQAAPGEDGETALEGRLEVDGALLGRFVTELLAREAGRPQSGMTGFDPLVSPAWPGALQG